MASTGLDMGKPAPASSLALELVRNLTTDLERTRDALDWLLSQTECGCEGHPPDAQIRVHDEPCPLAIATDIASGFRTRDGAYLPGEKPNHFVIDPDDTTPQRTYRIVSYAAYRAWHRATDGAPGSLCPHLCRIADLDEARLVCHALNERAMP